MTPEECDAFLRTTRIATLCTLNEDGSPNALPLWYEWDGSRVLMFSSSDTAKIRRLREDPRACLSVHDPVGAPEAWVSVEGTVEIEADGGQALALKLAGRYYTGDKLEATLAAWSRKENFVLLVLRPETMRSY